MLRADKIDPDLSNGRTRSQEHQSAAKCTRGQSLHRYLPHRIILRYGARRSPDNTDHRLLTEKPNGAARHRQRDRAIGRAVPFPLVDSRSNAGLTTDRSLPKERWGPAPFLPLLAYTYTETGQPT